MKKIGLTGNIAAGKSAVENIIGNAGYKIIDSDKICHDALENNENIINKIKKIFLNIDIFDEQGNFDRRKIGEIVFKDKKLKSELEKILHPFVINEIEKFFENNKNEKLIFASVPLLFEINIEKMFDKIILVIADENIRCERLMKRNNFSIDEARLRIDAQMKQELKIKKSDYVIENNSTLSDLEISVKKVIKEI